MSGPADMTYIFVMLVIFAAMSVYKLVMSTAREKALRSTSGT